MGVGGHFITHKCLITKLGNKWQWPRERDLTPQNLHGFHCETEKSVPNLWLMLLEEVCLGNPHGMAKEPTSSGHIASEFRGSHEHRPEPCGFRLSFGQSRSTLGCQSTPVSKKTWGGASTEMAPCGMAPIRLWRDLLEPGWVMSIVLCVTQ